MYIGGINVGNVILTDIQKEVLNKIEPNYFNLDKFELAEILERELEVNGLSNGTFNEYGLIIDKIIDLLLFNKDNNMLYI